MENSNKNPYKILEVNPKSNLQEIKSAYRHLVKKWHPDKGGDEKIIIEINAAWEILKDEKKRQEFDSFQEERNNLKAYNYNKQSNSITQINCKNGSKLEGEVINWIQKVYIPIDRLIGQVVNTYQSEIRKLSADPYDDDLMESFCLYIEKSQKKLEKINTIYTGLASPEITNLFSLSLYHCFSQVQDGINELERYTMGYVDNYLHDGKEMLIEAKKKRQQLHIEKKQITFV